MKTELSVNVDHVATLRQARGGEEPDPVGAAILALDAGAAGITLHLREGDPLPKDGGTVHVETEKGDAFQLRISQVMRTKRGYCVWCWLQKGKGDGERWRNARLQQATITY